MESVILTTPLLWIGYALALFFCLFDLIKRTKWRIFSLLSVALVLACTAYALILNATYYGVCTVILVFLALNLLPNLMSRGSLTASNKDLSNTEKDSPTSDNKGGNNNGTSDNKSDNISDNINNDMGGEQ